MRRISGGVLALALAAGLVAAQDKPRDAPSPQEQYKTLLKEWEDGIAAYSKAAREAKTNEERQKAFEKYYPRPDKLAPKFMALAEKHPKDAAAVDALVWVLNNAQGRGGKDDVRGKAIDIIVRDHIKSEKIGTLCQRMAFGYDTPSKTFLLAALEKSPHKDVQGQACLALAQMLRNRMRMAEMLKGRPEMAKTYEGFLGKETVAELTRTDPTKANKEIEGLLDRAAKDFADVKLPFRGTVGARAKSELYEIRHLAIGKVAPDVEGQDQDGKQFKLSDYRGKVVFLDFWSQF